MDGGGPKHQLFAIWGARSRENTIVNQVHSIPRAVVFFFLPKAHHHTETGNSRSAHTGIGFLDGEDYGPDDGQTTGQTTGSEQRITVAFYQCRESRIAVAVYQPPCHARTDVTEPPRSLGTSPALAIVHGRRSQSRVRGSLRAQPPCRAPKTRASPAPLAVTPRRSARRTTR